MSSQCYSMISACKKQWVRKPAHYNFILIVCKENVLLRYMQESERRSYKANWKSSLSRSKPLKNIVKRQRPN
ncbi:hypothetical protein KIN20_032751 [Parelaphostrongylus tenuis]|uniref:Uncharacterized protein n=1 Tax=Parelaphostrongylus tenuis TaxID=148309 RepID=A0AAD5WIB9_PARTN|nr:hypothetical protein KIN20_032751 [Parelaphostrongylus tenuis]